MTTFTHLEGSVGCFAEYEETMALSNANEEILSIVTQQLDIV